MQDAADSEIPTGQCGSRAGLREGADAHHPFGIEDGDDPPEMVVAGCVDRSAFVRRKLVRRPVASAGLHEDEGAVVRNEMVSEEGLRIAPSLGDRAPESGATDFAPAACETLDGASGMLVPRAVDAFLDAHPIANHVDLAEGDPGLGHAMGTGIHAEEEDAFRSVGETAEIAPGAPGGISGRIVDVGDGWAEADGGEAIGKPAGGSDQSLGMAQSDLSRFRGGPSPPLPEGSSPGAKEAGPTFGSRGV